LSAGKLENHVLKVKLSRLLNQENTINRFITVLSEITTCFESNLFQYATKISIIDTGENDDF